MVDSQAKDLCDRIEAGAAAITQQGQNWLLAESEVLQKIRLVLEKDARPSFQAFKSIKFIESADRF